MADHEQHMSDADREIARLRIELGRAYRAVRGFYKFASDGRLPDKTMLGYQAPTIGAAMRFVNEGALDGTEYFIGKPIEVLHDALAGRPAAPQGQETER